MSIRPFLPFQGSRAESLKMEPLPSLPSTLGTWSPAGLAILLAVLPSAGFAYYLESQHLLSKWGFLKSSLG